MLLMSRSYSEMRRLQSFEERFEYLSLKGQPGRSTFGHDRWMNQAFYTSREWRDTRQRVIARDEGLDLGCAGYEIYSDIVIHHINPITIQDIENASSMLWDLDNLITTTHDTHNAIHYGDKSLLKLPPVDRLPGDTKLW